MSDRIGVEVLRLLASHARGWTNLMTIDDAAHYRTTMNDDVKTRVMVVAKIVLEMIETGVEEVVITTIRIVIEEVDRMVDLATITVVD